MLKKCLPLLLLCTAPVFAKPVLTVYTYDSFAADWGPGPKIKKASPGPILFAQERLKPTVTAN